MIDAEYIFQNFDYEREIYVFIDSRSEIKEQFCRSFFPRERTDYTKGQSKMTLLYKEKINISLNESIIQVNKLKR